MVTRTTDSGVPPGYDPSQFPAFAVTVDVVILTMSGGMLHVLLVRRGEAPFEDMWAIPGGFKRPTETLDEAAKRELREETGVDAASVLAQFGAYGDPGRDPRMNDDFTRDGERYDLVLDVAGTRPFSALNRVLEPSATVVVVGGPRANRLLGPLGHLVGARLAALRASQQVVFFLARFDKADLATLRELIEDGSLTSVVDSVFALDDIGDALEHMGSGHPRGKIVVKM